MQNAHVRKKAQVGRLEDLPETEACNTKYRVILSVLDPRKCEYLKDYSLHFEHAYMTTYLAS